MSISVTFQGENTGVYLVETMLSQPVPVGDGRVIKELSSKVTPGDYFPETVMGGAGMLVPATYGADGGLVPLDYEGSGIDLTEALMNAEKQARGESVNQPYMFNPQARRFLVQGDNLIGWQNLMLTSPSVGGLGTFSAGMHNDTSGVSINPAGNATLDGGFFDNIEYALRKVDSIWQFFGAGPDTARAISVGASVGLVTLGGLLCTASLVPALVGGVGGFLGGFGLTSVMNYTVKVSGLPGILECFDLAASGKQTAGCTGLLRGTAAIAGRFAHYASSFTGAIAGGVSTVVKQLQELKKYGDKISGKWSKTLWWSLGIGAASLLTYGIIRARS